MFRFCVDKPVIVAVGMLLVCLFGVLGILRVPVQMIPDLDVRTVTVLTQWPGATPQDVEREIIVEQEQYLRSIPGIERMTSSASMGRSQIELEFPFGTDITEVLIRVNNALSQVPGYPENVDEPTLIAQSFSSNPFMFYMVRPLDGSDTNVLSLKDYVEDYVVPEISRVSGISDADLIGGASQQVHIRVDPARLAERGLTITDLRNAIRGRNRDLSGGDLDSGKRRYLVRTIGRFEDLSEVRDMVIATRGDALVRLGDVADVELDLAEERFISMASGDPSMMIRVRRQSGSNVVATRDAVVERVPQLNSGPLAARGVFLQLDGEDAQYVEDAAANVRQNLMIGALLATVVLFLFLRSWRATAVGAIGIPVCTMAAFLGLLLVGRTINVISLAGVAFAIGMTLDNSIVVLENIYRHRAMGKRPIDSALDGVTEVWRAVLASTLTTVFVFLPVLFVEQEVGQLYSDIAIAISASILASMLVSVAVVPAACRFIIRGGDDVGGQDDRLSRFGARFAERISSAVGWLNRGLRRSAGMAAAVLLVAFVVIAFLTPKANYLPEGEEKKAFAQLFTPPGYRLSELKQAAMNLNDTYVPYLREDPDEFTDGNAEVPALDIFNVMGNVSGLMAIIEVTDKTHIEDMMTIVSDEMGEVPGMRHFVSRGSIFVSNRGGARSINIDINGPRLDELYEASQIVYARSRDAFDGAQVRSQPSALVMAQPVLEVRPRWERAAELGFTAEQIGYTVWALADGAYVDEFYLDDRKIDMYLYSSGGTIDHPEDLDGLTVFAPNGRIVPLSAVAAVDENVTTDTIRRVDGARSVTISVVPPSEIPLETAVEIIQRDVIDDLYASGTIDRSITMDLTGASDLLTASREALAGNFIVAILISYLLLVAILNHWGYPLVIMLTVPVGISGGILGLSLLNLTGSNLDLFGGQPFHQPLDMITMLGFLILIGTVVNNPILIVERTMAGVREGVENSKAIRDAVRARLRPILMSTITTVFGLSPLVFLPGAGAELYRGVGAVVLFGLLFSALVTLFFLPAVLELVLAARDRLGRGKTADAAI